MNIDPEIWEKVGTFCKDNLDLEYNYLLSEAWFEFDDVYPQTTITEVVQYEYLYNITEKEKLRDKNTQDT